MHRRTFLAGVGAVLLTAPPSAEAQQTGKVYRIALLPDVRPALEPLLKTFTETLSELGRIEGRDFVFYRSGIFYGDDTDRAVREVLNAKPDLIFGFNLGYIVAAHKLTKTIPIVMWVSGFPVEGGVAVSLARPGKNVTGLTIYAGAEVFGKLVQLLREVKPSVKRIGAFCSYVPPFHPPEESDLIIQEMRDGGRRLGIEVRILEIAKPEQVGDALATVAAERMDALLLTGEVSMVPRRKEIMQSRGACRQSLTPCGAGSTSRSC